mgnify:CR=1 FL=1
MSVMRRPLGIYLHIPFCKSKCGYCDFCSFPGVSGTDRSLYVRELVKDLRRWGEKIGADYTVDTVYFGGGTPTLLLPSEFEALLAALSDAFWVRKSPPNATRVAWTVTIWRHCVRAGSTV